MKIGKRQFPSYRSNSCYEEEKLLQKLEFYSTTEKIELTG